MGVQMLRSRTSIAIALAVTALVASSTAGSAAPGQPSRAGGAQAAGQPSDETQAFVVGFDTGQAAAVGAIEAAGGTVVDVNEDIGLALVNTTSDSFAANVTSQDGVTAVARNHAVGEARPNMPHRFAEERAAGGERPAGPTRTGSGRRGGHGRGPEPLADLQWNMQMIGATADGAHRRATGEGVDVGVIDTGIDGTHPDIAPNFDARRSRNFTMDIPEIDGPCETPTCIDPNNVDDFGHGTHVAGIVGADDNRFGVGGVAPDVNLVNLRASQDSGYFFVYETVAALTEAGNLRLDVVNMSFFTDPWLFNCPSRDEYVSGDVSDAEIAEQAFILETVLAAVDYAHDRGVTLVAAAGNEHLDLAAPTRSDTISPDFPPDENGDGINARPRVVTNRCLDVPGEAPNVIQASAVGPSTTKSDFSNYGAPNIEVAAPGGFALDFFGTPAFNTSPNRVLSPYPLDVAIENGLADADGNPTTDRSVRYCDSRGRCGFYTRLQGTSMASPHAAGVAALIIEEHGRRTRGGGRALDPAIVERILSRTATDHPCPPGGVEDYTQEGRPPEFNAVCVGTTADNSLYGEGIVNATQAVR
jgi:subtilisin family serine protease